MIIRIIFRFILWPAILLGGIYLPWAVDGYPFAKCRAFYAQFYPMTSIDDWLHIIVFTVPLSLGLLYWFFRPNKVSFICSMVGAWFFTSIPGMYLTLILTYRGR